MPSPRRFAIFALPVVLLAAAASPASAATQTFGPGFTWWVVPAGVTSITVDLTGGSGGADVGGNGCVPGKGGRVQGTIAVRPGQAFSITVGTRGHDATGGSGGGGGDGAGTLDGGDGGSAGVSSNGNPALGGGGGGAGSAIANTNLSQLYAVAAGGGGCGGFANGIDDGDGGDANQAGHSGVLATGGTVDGPGGTSAPATEPGGHPYNDRSGGAGAGASTLHLGGGGGGGGSGGGGGGGGAELLHGIAGGGAGGRNSASPDLSNGVAATAGDGSLSISFSDASAQPGETAGELFPVSSMDIIQGRTTLQTGVTPGSPYRIAHDGVITSWSVETGLETPPSGFELKVARVQHDQGIGTGDYTIIGSAVAGPLQRDGLNTFAARIPVKAGDVLGSFQATHAYGRLTVGNSPEAAVSTVDDIATGDTAHFDYDDIDHLIGVTTWSGGGVKIPVSAQVEPDADGDGFGDLTQDNCPGTAGSVTGCPPGTGTSTTPPSTPPANTPPPPSDTTPAGSTPSTPSAPSTPSVPAPSTPRAPATPPYAGIAFAAHLRTVTVSRNGVAKLRLSSARSVSGTLTLNDGRKVIGHVAIKLAAGKPKTVAVKLSRAGLALLQRHHGRLPAVAGASAAGKATRARVTLKLGS